MAVAALVVMLNGGCIGQKQGRGEMQTQQSNQGDGSQGGAILGIGI
jgi:hypothetical protein